jgi:hypothetical protein
VALHFDVNNVWNSGRAAKHPSVTWYRYVISNYFVASQVVFLVFSANASAYGPFFAAQQQRDPQVRFAMIDEPEAVSLTLMTLCKHHIVASSSLGFWGMFSNAQCIIAGSISMSILIIASFRALALMLIR